MGSEIAKLGDKRRGKEIGKLKDPSGWYIYQACMDCGKERWVKCNRDNMPKMQRCGSCSCKRHIAIHGHPWQGRHHSEETKERISSSHRKLHLHGQNGVAWKGGRGFIKQSGYIWVYVSQDDFFYPMARKTKHIGGRIAEHRLVMAKYLGRCLLPWEIVHHKNGIRNDNRLENLELVKGQKNHLPSIHSKQAFDRLNKRIEVLESRITQLEAENLLFKAQLEALNV